jgi:FAD/FMN-containing dehydrogenase
MIAHTDTSKTLERELRRHTSGEVLFTSGDRARYATDASIYQETPIGVFVPKTDTDVEASLGVARNLGVPLVPRGGGTSQCGQTVGAGLVIDHSKYLRHVTNLDLENRLVTVQPGMVLDHLNAQLKQHGLWYPVDVSTSAQATLGGMAGNNSCGSRSIKYGNMVHNVEGLSMLTAAGWLSAIKVMETGFTRFTKMESGLLMVGLMAMISGKPRKSFSNSLKC